MRKRVSCLAIVLGTTLAIHGVFGQLRAQETPPPPPAPGVGPEGAAPALPPTIPAAPADQVAPTMPEPAPYQPAIPQQPAPYVPAPPPAPVGQAAPVEQGGVEVLTRGPLHEAFAEVIAYNPQAGQVVGQQPPNPVEEVPPAEKPAGDYLWIPGYWAFDQDRNNYIWISGVWRAPPPGTTWVPGYWSQAANGFQWTSGYWAPVSATMGATRETEYLPAPPQTLEAGASSPAPSADHFWVPGYWQWQGVRYAWRAGYWGRMQPNWVWIPARYVWSPSGYVFLAGHWDYVMAQRGLAFCPVAYSSPIYMQAGYAYTPSVCIQTAMLNDYLFCRPAYGHYYFGDYYDPRYVQIGIYPWFSVESRRVGYEPTFVYDRWYYGRRDPRWEANLRVQYDYRVAHLDARPPHVYSVALEGRGGIVLGTPLARISIGAKAPFHMEAVSAERREQYRAMGGQLRQVQTERRNMELQAHAEHRGGPGGAPVRLKMSAAPLASAHAAGYEAGRGEARGRVETPRNEVRPRTEVQPRNEVRPRTESGRGGAAPGPGVTREGPALGPSRTVRPDNVSRAPQPANRAPQPASRDRSDPRNRDKDDRGQR